MMDFDGTHLLADLFDCTGLDDIKRVERALRAAVSEACATLLEMKLHSFGEQQGVTGIALLAESHISIHTWPERDYAAIDIFLCGAQDNINAALAAIAVELGAGRIVQQQFARGFRAFPDATA